MRWRIQVVEGYKVSGNEQLRTQTRHWFWGWRDVYSGYSMEEARAAAVRGPKKTEYRTIEHA